MSYYTVTLFSLHTGVQSHEAHFANTRSQTLDSHGAFLTQLHKLTATALVNWQKSNEYCPVTGTPSTGIYPWRNMCQINQHRRQACSTLAEARSIHHCVLADVKCLVLVFHEINCMSSASKGLCLHTAFLLSASKITSAPVFRLICTHALPDLLRLVKRDTFKSAVRCSERPDQ